jgi:hypothetical protein
LIVERFVECRLKMNGDHIDPRFRNPPTSRRQATREHLLRGVLPNVLEVDRKEKFAKICPSVGRIVWSSAPAASMELSDRRRCSI